MSKLTGEERELFEGLQKKFRVLFRRAGHGSKKRILEEVGITRAGFDYTVKNGSVTLLLITRVLKALGVKRGEFFSEVFPHDRALPPGQPPRAVLHALELMQEEREKKKKEGKGE